MVMILRKKCLSLFLSLSLVLPNLAPIYSYAEEATSINREEQKIKSENSQKEKVSKQLDEKFDLNGDGIIDLYDIVNISTKMNK